MVGRHVSMCSRAGLGFAENIRSWRVTLRLHQVEAQLHLPVLGMVSRSHYFSSHLEKRIGISIHMGGTVIHICGWL